MIVAGGNLLFLTTPMIDDRNFLNNNLFKVNLSISEHPKILLFISDCGQQSTDEAIAAEVPILGLPRAAEQWRNAEQLLRHNVGTVLNLQETDDETFKDVIELAIKSES